MKKDFSKILIIIAIVLLIEGIGFLAAGVITDTLWLIILSGVFLGLYVFLGDFYLLKVIRQARTEKLQKNQYDLKQTENEMVRDVNSTDGLENYINIRAHQFANIVHSWKVATVPEKIGLVLFISLVSGGFISIIVLMCLQYMLACAIVFGVQVCIVCGTIIVAKYIEKQSFSFHNINGVLPRKGKVIACCLHTQSTVSKGEASRLEYESKYLLEQRMTTRIIETVYRLKLNLNGKKVTAFSKQFYNVGEEVFVCQNTKCRRVYVVAAEQN